jgi:hypothetical protein
MDEQELPLCPLVTDYTTRKGIDPRTLEKLFVVRKWDTEKDENGKVINPIPFVWPSHLRKKIYDVTNQCETDAPLELRQYQIQQIHHLVRMPKFINGDSVGLGKAQPLDAKILTPSGWKTMGGMTVGQEVVDPDGDSSFVTGVYPQGEVDIYRVELNDGSTTECCGDHLWTVQTPDDRMRGTERTMTTLQLLEHGLTRIRGNGNVTSQFFLPIAVPTVWDCQPKLPLHPYTLGALLGDGGIKYGVVLTSADAEVVERVQAELPEGLHLRQCADQITWHISKGMLPDRGTHNPYITTLRSLRLFGCGSSAKFIPEVYLRSSLTARMELLRGLMDTDGECSKAGLCYLSTVSHQLALDVAELVRSLGGIAKVRVRKPKWYPHKGEKRLGQPGYTVTIKTHLSPFHLQRKSERWKSPQFARAIHSVTFVGKKLAQCIKVSSKRHLYITDDYIVTHNTISTIAAFCWLKERNPDLKLVVVCPKSVTYQWEEEFLRFSTLRPYVMKDTYRGLKTAEARYQQMIHFFEGKKKDVLICKYSSMIGTRRKIEGKFDEDGNPVNGREKLSQEAKMFTKILKENKENVVLILDECQKFKGVASSTRNLVFSLCRAAGRVWGLTATAIKNDLTEFYAIATAIGIVPFGWMSDFLEEFCIHRKQHIGQGRFKKILVGYQNIPKFKRGIRPFYLGRSQRQVKEPLPQLTTIYHPLDLDDKQAKLLVDIPAGVFQLPPALIKVLGEWHEKERDPDNLMTRMSVQQLVANHWALLDPHNEADYHTKKLSPKEEALLDMLDGDLLGEKVIAFAQPLTSKVLTPVGWRLMGDLKVGDEVIDPDTGGEAYVQGVFPQGSKPTYKITMKSGAQTEATGDHLWLMQSATDRNRGKGWRLRTTEQIIRQGLQRKNKNGTTANKALLPVPVASRFLSNESLPIPPYTLGVLLGDGDIVSGSVVFGVAPPKDDHGFNANGANVYKNALRNMGLYGSHSHNKFIPEVYLRASVGERLELLKGLLDTDGCCTKLGYVNFRVTSQRLASDVAELVRSLGGLATTPQASSSVYTLHGEKLRGRDCWAVSIRLPVNPFHLKRKADRWKSNVAMHNPISKIEYIGEKECQCIRVSSKRSLYITDDYVVTHNTKYKTWINRLEWLTNNGHFTNRKFLRITGDENEKQRSTNKQLFQNSPDHDLIVINAAGLEGINLQQAAHMVCLDVPWGWGDLIQLVGRMVRMASPHSACTLHILVSKGTIDEYAIETLKGKKGVFDAILGESHSAGLLENKTVFALDDGMEMSGSDEEFTLAMLRKAHDKGGLSMGTYLVGEKIEEAKGNADYQMAFEKKGKKTRTKKKQVDKPLKWHVDTL